MDFKTLYEADMARYGGKADKGLRRFHRLLRKEQTAKNKLLRLWYHWRYKCVRDKYLIEIFAPTKIGKGLYIGHPCGISVNVKAVIGENVNIHKGVTIGQENRGKRKGAPTIGNRVWIGINATVVGNITIGDDVLIAPNTYVNCDVPAHSIVFGNPCIIKPRENATEGYINHTV